MMVRRNENTNSLNLKIRGVKLRKLVNSSIYVVRLLKMEDVSLKLRAQLPKLKKIFQRMSRMFKVNIDTNGITRLLKAYVWNVALYECES